MSGRHSSWYASRWVEAARGAASTTQPSAVSPSSSRDLRARMRARFCGGSAEMGRRWVFHAMACTMVGLHPFTTSASV